ncbi:NAD-dependent histone deacetylase HST3 [Diaporthe eres]|nr:NAD-dependent histone deacetylase HST3 [Diaporthe eres]
MPERNGVIDFLVKLPVDKQEACGKQITLEISKDKKLLEKLNKAVSRLRSRYEVCLVSAAKKAKIPPNEARGDTKLQNTNESHDTPASLTSPSSNEPPEAQASETLFHPQNDEPKSSDLEMSPSCPLNEPLDQPSNHAISAPPLHQPSSINDESMVVLAAASISSYEHYFSELLATAVSGYQYVQLAAAATESAQDVHYLVLEVVPDKIKQMAEVLCGRLSVSLTCEAKVQAQNGTHCCAMIGSLWTATTSHQLDKAQSKTALHGGGPIYTHIFNIMSLSPPRRPSKGCPEPTGPHSGCALDEIAHALAHAQRVLVIAGAGISTSAGIPVSMLGHVTLEDLLIRLQDYRSPGGLYAKGGIFTEAAFRDERSRLEVQKQALALRQLAKSSQPTKTHDAITELRNSGKLLRCYTQNIDMLENKAGLETDLDAAIVDCVQLHGSLELLRCSICSSTAPTENYVARISAGEDLHCPHCTHRSSRREEAGKRRLRVGLLLPDFIRIGQQDHPHGEVIGKLIGEDQSAGPDFLLILGTSLKTHGSKKVAKQFARTVRVNGGMVVYVNLTEPLSEWRGLLHYWVRWECDAWVKDLETRVTGSSFQNPIVLD